MPAFTYPHRQRVDQHEHVRLLRSGGVRHVPTLAQPARHHLGRRTARRLTVMSCVFALVLGGPLAVDAVAAPLPRLDLRVLVVDDGNPWTEAIRQDLDIKGVASTVVELADPARPTIT